MSTLSKPLYSVQDPGKLIQGVRSDRGQITVSELQLVT